MAGWLQRQWFEQRRLSPALWLLLPLFWPLLALFVGVSAWRRRRIRPEYLPVTVVVVGNITVGGAGKTPLTLWLAEALRQAGRRPGIVSRGYGRRDDGVRPVAPTAKAAEVGDEPLLLARRSGLPVWVGADRAAAGRALLAAHPEVDVILCDDGLQHLKLGRDVELAVFDGRGAGNGWRLPFGPLREALGRLRQVDAIVCNGPRDTRLPAAVPVFDMRLGGAVFHRLDVPGQTCPAVALRGRTLRAIAGIGDPGRFFRTLAGLGLECATQAFPDHHAYTPEELRSGPETVLLMTEKDAVKCAGLTSGETWFLPVAAELEPALVELVLEKLRGRQVA